MTTVLFVVDKVLEWAWPRYRDWLKETFSEETRRKWFWRTLFAFVFISEFLAWKEEYTKHLASQNELIEAQTEIVSLKAQPRIGEETQTKINNLTQTNQQLQQEVKKLRDQTTEMQANAAPRYINDLERFVIMLSLFRGQKVDVEYVASDREAENFLGLIRLAIEVSGWTIEGAAAVSGQTWDGVLIEVNDLREAMPAAYEFARLLTQQNTAFAIKQRLGPSKPGSFQIRVGYKLPGKGPH